MLHMLVLSEGVVVMVKMVRSKGGQSGGGGYTGTIQGFWFGGMVKPVGWT